MLIADVRIMFEYLYWVRDRVLATASQVPDATFLSTETVTTRDLRGTLVHELDVEWSWRRRLRATPAEPWDADAELQASDFPTLRELAERWRDDAAEMRSWLAELTDDAVVAPWEGERPGGPALWVFLIHVVEHGITELSDAAVLLRRVGRPTGSLTFLDFIDPVPPKTDDA